MSNQLLSNPEQLNIKLTKELILKTCWEIEAEKTMKYVKEFPHYPETFQWSIGGTEWLVQKIINGRKYGMFLNGSSRDTIDLYLVGNPNICEIWNIGFDGKWVWRRNPNIEFDLDRWWNKNWNQIRLLEKV